MEKIDTYFSDLAWNTHSSVKEHTIQEHTIPCKGTDNLRKTQYTHKEHTVHTHKEHTVHIHKKHTTHPQRTSNPVHKHFHFDEKKMPQTDVKGFVFFLLPQMTLRVRYRKHFN